MGQELQTVHMGQELQTVHTGAPILHLCPATLYDLIGLAASSAADIRQLWAQSSPTSSLQLRKLTLHLLQLLQLLLLHLLLLHLLLLLWIRFS